MRLIRQVTPEGKVRVLMTSRFDAERFPAEAFAQRWRIEEAFKSLKHRLSLKHTGGLSWFAARQDFGTKALCDNLAALAAWCAARRHLEPDALWRINRTLAFTVLPRAPSPRCSPRSRSTSENSPRNANDLAPLATNSASSMLTSPWYD
ncbi:hypothetical protein [Aromatoleum petrolei]|uniref:Transposase n=1 Tax=Aromatoleum petrolei TaxID=76116 RepID=A0ABX1MPS3_9RHOO|nr:hypothetical protein [Aromatoleum petrolei]NMF88124.1 hypothetical protein [Aromatoleum petrolei]QTQ38913.1 Uncharacterized protein ToN1_48190 [Aromatoleum petrolei]